MKRYGTSDGGVSILVLLAIVFSTLKLLGKIDWSWWWVLIPLWFPLALVLILVLLIFLFLAVQQP